MRHIQWTLNENKNIHFVPFPTRIRHLCITQTHINCYYIKKVITNGAGSVVVSTSNWQADCSGLIRADTAGLAYLV